MHCPAWHQNPEQAKFCLECGAGLALNCSHCGAVLPPSAKFCLECGERVMPSRPQMVSLTASPEAYTPKHLAERICTTKTALGGERTQISRKRARSSTPSPHTHVGRRARGGEHGEPGHG
jgi:ribosomal protein L40E